MEPTNSVTPKNRLTLTKSGASRIALAERKTPDACQRLRETYWTWHFDESVAEAFWCLLSTDLGWEQMPQLTTPPVEEIVSPLGRALAHSDKAVRDAARLALDVRVHIPAGTAYIGETCEPLPVDAFDMAVYPVTNAQYHAFVEVTGHPPPEDWTDGVYAEGRGDHPVVWVTCADAAAYARYVGGRLPTFAEWQYAARGGDMRLFPWGDEIDRPRCNTAELGAGATTPVISFNAGASPFGCYDMVGNVWEWTATPYDDAGDFRVACGGAWYYNHDYSTCTSYDFFSTGYAEFVIGFRVVYPATPREEAP